MMNKHFIKIEMHNNEFRITKSQFTLLGMTFIDVNCKIDTGCSYSTIPLIRLNIPSSQVKAYKRHDANNLINILQNHVNNGMSIKDAINTEIGRSFKLSYGVESGGMTHKPINFLNIQDIINEPAISFKHKIQDIEFNTVEIPDRDIFVNYDRKGNILIGMDILKDWNIHMGTLDTGETIFLGCLKDQMSDIYIQELEDTFHISSDINAHIIRNKI